MNEKRWIGDVYGAKVGYAFYVEQSDGNGSLSVGLRDGSSAVKLLTKRLANQPRILLYPNTLDQAIDNSTAIGRIDFDIETEDGISGKWEYNDGAAGVIQLQRSNQSRSPSEQSAIMALRLWNKEIPLAAITLYRSDLLRVIAELETHVPEPRRTTIRATEDGQIIIMPIDVYLGRRDLPDRLTDLVISCEQIVTQGFKKIINITLAEDESSQIFISSPDELWTAAAGMRVDNFLKPFTSGLTNWFRHYGLNINSIILLIVIIWLPDRPLQRLAAFAAAAFVIFLIVRSHRLVPYSRVYLNPDQERRPFARQLPSFLNALAVAATLFAVSYAPQLLELIKSIVVGVWNILTGL